MAKPDQMERLALSPAEAADQLGLGLSNVYALVAARELPSFRVGQRILIPVEGLKKWLRRKGR